MTVPPSAPPGAATPMYFPLQRVRAVYVLLFVIGGVFVLESLAGGADSSRVLLQFGIAYSPLVTGGDYGRLFTTIFLHVSLLQVAINGYSLYAVGRSIEALYGSARFSAIFLLAALAGNIAAYALLPQPSAVVGAATGLFGLMGAILAFFWRNRTLFGRAGQRQLQSILLITAFNLVLNLMLFPRGIVGLLGGFLGGLILGWLLCPWYQLRAGPEGKPNIVDVNSLRAEWLGLVLFSLLLIVALWAAVHSQPAPEPVLPSDEPLLTGWRWLLSSQPPV